MSKAEERIYKATERALEAYPVNEVDSLEEMQNEMKRTIFCKGYHQAEKDLELTWEDIKKIDVLIYAVLDEEKYKRYYMQDRDGDFYKEVLKRFKETKEHGTK